jgi:hypothetical protein
MFYQILTSTKKIAFLLIGLVIIGAVFLPVMTTATPASASVLPEDVAVVETIAGGMPATLKEVSLGADYVKEMNDHEADGDDDAQETRRQSAVDTVYVRTSNAADMDRWLNGNAVYGLPVNGYDVLGDVTGQFVALPVNDENGTYSFDLVNTHHGITCAYVGVPTQNSDFDLELEFLGVNSAWLITSPEVNEDGWIVGGVYDEHLRVEGEMATFTGIPWHQQWNMMVCFTYDTNLVSGANTPSPAVIGLFADLFPES